jgi:membrane protease YdiL (CAAX protease family)
MKDKLSKLLENPYSVIAVLIIASLLSLADRNFGYFFGLGVVLFIVWRNRWDWSIFGFGKKINLKTILIGICLTIPLFVGQGIIDVFLQRYFGELDLSSVEHIRGDFGNYLILMAIMWVFAAFGEELLFRGYYMQGFAKLFGGTNLAWLVAAILISIYFGISHSYQGTAGIISVFIGSMYFSMIYYMNRDNLALAALVHGFYDTIGLTLIYMNKDGVFSDWVFNLIK